MRIVKKGILILLMVLGCVSFVDTKMENVDAAVEGEVVIQGNKWLFGKGVDVRSNGGNYSTYWQCVEIAQMRLYPKMGWPRVYAGGNGGASNIPEGSPGLIRYNPGSNYIPVPGDLIIENPTAGNRWGHVAIVNNVVGNTIYAVEQNTGANSNGWHTYSYNKSYYSGGYGSIKAVLHAPQNKFSNSGNTQANINSNISHVDHLKLSGGRIYAKGWSFNKNLQPIRKTDPPAVSKYVFIIDASTHLELGRINTGFTYRDDVAKHLSLAGYRNGGYGGFDFSYGVSPSWKGKRVYLMVRFSKDTKGDVRACDDNYIKTSIIKL